MRMLPFIVVLLLGFSAHAKSGPGCVKLCPQTCMTTEMAMVAKVACMPNLDKRLDRCAMEYGQCVRIEGKDRATCEWRETKKFKRCMSKPS